VTPPHNIEAEQSVLGGILLDNDILPAVLEILSGEEFYRAAHRSAFAGIVALFERNEPCDLVTLTNLLKSENKLDEAGGASYLASLLDRVPSAANAGHYARIVREKALRRRLIAQIQWIEVSAQDPTRPINETIALANQTLIDMAGHGDQRRTLAEADTRIDPYLDQEPAKREYLFGNVLPARVVAALVAAGGSSKGFLLMAWAVGLATAERVLQHFVPPRPFKVLALFAEDSAEEIHRRLFHTVRTAMPDMTAEAQARLLANLHVASVMRKAVPLMELKDGNPTRAPMFYWLRRTIEAHPGLEVLFIDPKSRFYGLEENANQHNTAWVACLEELVDAYGLTIVFSHHVGKASQETFTQAAARGGSALVDACRWVANLRVLTEEAAKRLDIDNRRSYVEFDVTKSNYAPALPRTLTFRRGPQGVLVPESPASDRLRDIADRIPALVQEA
jgi:RecA-family ATPase